MGRDGGAASAAAAATSASWGAADCGGMAYNGGAACDGGLAAGSVAWLTTVLRRKPAASRTTAARRTVAARRRTAVAVVVTRSFPEIFPQLSDRFNHTNTRASCKKPPTKEHLSQSVIFFCAHQIAIFHLFDRQHRHSPDR